MKILLTGGTGKLGIELQKIDGSLIAPSHQAFDITDQMVVLEYIARIKPDMVIHAAAMTDNRVIERNTSAAIDTNIIGTANIAIACIKHGVRLVYLSTDYVYKGDRGLYRESDEVLPFNYYAWTKLAGEAAVRGVSNHLIIRTSFGARELGYKVAFIDKYTSKDYTDVIAPMIYNASVSPANGTINIGTDRKTVYGLVSQQYTTTPVSLRDTYFNTPVDTSLNLQKLIEVDEVAHSHTHCRVCNSTDLSKYLDLGVMPLANNLNATAEQARTAERFPLQVMYCNKCALSQTSVIVSPRKLFSHYTYRSGINAGYIKHCTAFAKSLDLEGKFVIDIAGNDGTLLKQFKSVGNCKVLNVDPAANLTAVAEASGIPSLTAFWGEETASNVLKVYGEADFITATNVFAHVPDMRGFLNGVKTALSNEGLFIVEFPYIVDFIEHKEFDTVYFEHMSYLSLLPIIRLSCEVGMKVVDVSKQNIHGGTLRVSIAKQTSRHQPSGAVEHFLNAEIKGGYNKFETYQNWQTDVNKLIRDFTDIIVDLKIKGNKIAAFAASAKGNTLLNAAGMTTDLIDFIADETPEKIGKFSPGTGIPIVHKDIIQREQPDFIIILSWNFANEIMAKLRPVFKGKFIVPIPQVEIIV